MKYNDVILKVVNLFISDGEEFTIKDIVKELRDGVNNFVFSIVELDLNITSFEVQNITHKDVRDRFEELKGQFIDQLDIKYQDGYRTFIPKQKPNQGMPIVPDDSPILTKHVTQIKKSDIVPLIFNTNNNKIAILVTDLTNLLFPNKGFFISLSGKTGFTRKSDATNALYKFLEQTLKVVKEDKKELRKTVKALFKSGELSFKEI